MDLTSGMPFWLVKNGLLHTYPRLQNNISCDVLIIGSGITGSLAAHYLCRENIDCVVVDKRHAGMGSTVASTALLQYEIDMHLSDLIVKIGREQAVMAYKLCLESIDMLENIITELNLDCGYTKSSTLYCASKKKDIKKLKKEFEVRKKYALPAEWLDGKDVEEFSVFKSAAIYNDASAKVDPYRLSHGLLQFNHLKKGLPVYTNTEVKKIRNTGEKFICLTQDGNNISCRKIIIAAGYETVGFSGKEPVNMNSSYVIISEPLPKEKLWKEEAMIWETDRPYTYIRTTEDNRIIAGGEDIPYRNPKLRDKMMSAKCKLLEKKFKKFLPGISFNTDFYWCGTFAETPDGLPYIGHRNKTPGLYYSMGFGGNGIIFSILAANIILKDIQKTPLSYADTFGFERIN